MKIAYIIEVIYNSGGMERVLSVCANSLCQDLDVSIVTLYQKGRPTYFPLDNRIHCYDLGLEGVANRTLLKERLTEFLMSHHFDIVITMGGMDMYYLHSIKDGSKKIAWFHFAIDIAKTTWAGPNPTVLQKVKAQLIGTPIISTNAGGIPSLIEDGETGFLYPYSEPHALAFKIMNLAGNKEELEKVSDNESCFSQSS